MATKQYYKIAGRWNGRCYSMSTILTVDSLLDQVYTNIGQVEKSIPAKDCRILISLSKQIAQGNFLTENQSKLLVKIFKENIRAVKKVNANTDEILNATLWSRTFRVIPRIRKIFIDPTKSEKISMKFTYDKRLKLKLSGLGKKLYGSVECAGHTDYQVALTEQNILVLVDEFEKDDFEVDQKIMDFYQEICNSVDLNKNTFNVLLTDDTDFQNIVAVRAGKIATDNLVSLYDNRHAYQYQISDKISEKSLKNSIAQRATPKVYIDSKAVELTNVMTALQELGRFPALIVFDGHDANLDKKILENLQISLEKCGLADQVGIYFRFDKTADTNGFNSTISELGYNKNLTDSTQVVGIANNKIPKFMIKMGWKPRTVISFTNTFKNNKSAIYFSDVDLVIYYNDKLPLGGSIDAIV